MAQALGPWQRQNTKSLSSALEGLLPVIRHPPTRRHVNRDGPSPVRAWSIWSYAYVAMAAAVIVSPQLAIRRSSRRRPPSTSDADTVQVAADELKEKGFTLLHDAHTEPWGQTVARLQSIEGAIIGISYAPTMHS